MEGGAVGHSKLHAYFSAGGDNQHTGVGDSIPLTTAGGGFTPVNYTPTADTIRGHLEGLDTALGAVVVTLQAAYNTGQSILTTDALGPITVTNSDRTVGNSLIDFNLGAVALTGNMPGVLIDSSGITNPEAFGHAHIRMVHPSVTYAAAVTGFVRGLHVDAFGAGATITANAGASGFEYEGIRIDLPDYVEAGGGSAEVHGLTIIGHTAPASPTGSYHGIHVEMASSSDVGVHVATGSMLLEGGQIRIIDTATPLASLFQMEDNSNVVFLSVDQDTIDYGIAGNRGFEFIIDATGRDGIRFLPDGRTQTTTAAVAAMLTWDSTIVADIPGGGGIGNDTAPSMIVASGEARFDDPGNLFLSAILFNQSTTMTANGVNVGPAYSMVNQPILRTGTLGGSRTFSQANAVRSQLRLGPNLAGNVVLTSHEPYFVTVFVDATIGTASITTLNYFAPKAPTLTAGGTIGTLNVLDIPNIPGTGITTLRGINSAMASGTFINHTGASTSRHVGDIRFGATGVPSNDVSVSGNQDITGELYIGATGPVGAEILRVAGGSLLAGDVEIDGALNHDGTTAGFYAATPVVQAADPGALVDSTTGTANLTVVAVPAVGGSGATAAQEAAINDNFADLIAIINALRAMLSAGAGGVGISA